MSETDPPRNNLAWRVSVLEGQVRALQEGKPDVIAERVQTLTSRVADLKTDVNDDMADLREDIKNVRRILLGFLTGVTFVVLGAVISIIATS